MTVPFTVDAMKAFADATEAAGLTGDQVYVLTRELHARRYTVRRWPLWATIRAGRARRELADLLRHPDSHDLPVAVFLDRYRPAYGATWLDAIASLAEEPDATEVVAALRQVLAGGADFNEPVLVNDDEGYVANGMHRITATILEARPTIRFVTTWPDHPGPIFEATFRCPIPDGDPGDDLICRVFSRLQSFPHPTGWIEALSLSFHGGRFEGVWYCPPGLLETALVAVVVARLTDIGVQAGDIISGPWTDDD